MLLMKKNKSYDAVQAMRETREKLSLQYWQNPELLKQEMKSIREKYSPGNVGAFVSKGQH